MGELVSEGMMYAKQARRSSRRCLNLLLRRSWEAETTKPRKTFVGIEHEEEALEALRKLKVSRSYLKLKTLERSLLLLQPW